MRILITGITGFVGSHLTRLLQARQDVECVGVAREVAWSGEIDERFRQIPVQALDLCDRDALQKLLERVEPQQIYHLAGYADTGGSFKDPDAAWTGNLTATRNLYEAIAAWGGRPRILFVGSGAVYGEPVNANSPLDETSPLRPNNPYSASKAAADLVSYQYFCTHGLEIIRTRPFNHIGPGQSARFAVPNFARQIAMIELGRQAPVLRVGNLDTERDLTDVRDVVRAYEALMAKGQAGEVYNIATGVTTPVRVHLEKLLAFSRIRVRIESDPELLRKVDTAAVRVDVNRLRRTTGWSCQYSLDQTLADTLGYWRCVATDSPST
jgi:GDP-4-dehydro-6-deoxy-D-mannose reductase